MEELVTKTSLELDKQSSSRDSGVKCLLYEARNSLNGQQPAANYWNSWESLTLKWLYHKLWLQELSQQQLSWQNLEKVLKDPLPFTNYPWMKITLKCFVTFHLSTGQIQTIMLMILSYLLFPDFPSCFTLTVSNTNWVGGGGERENRDINTTYHTPFCLKVKFSFQVHLST